MANANPSPTGGERPPTAPPAVAPTVLVVLPCTLPPVLLDRLLAIGAARAFPADAPAAQWVAATAATAGRAVPDADPSLLAARLSPCELEIVRLIGLGHSTAAIAKIRCKSTKTIESQKSRIKKRLGFDSQMALSQWACRWVDGETARRAA